MAFLDFIRNRNASQQQPVANKSQEQKPETAKEMYTRQAAQEKTNPIDRMPTGEQAKMAAIKAKLEKATEHLDRTAATPAAAPADGMENREAMRQNMTGQDQTAPALSPTSVQKGQPATEKDNKLLEKPRERPQTLPRPRPSWER